MLDLRFPAIIRGQRNCEPCPKSKERKRKEVQRTLEVEAQEFVQQRVGPVVLLGGAGIDHKETILTTRLTKL